MMKRFVDKIVKSVVSESNYFKGAFLANLRKNLQTSEEYSSKENSIAVYQKVYEYHRLMQSAAHTRHQRTHDDQ